MAQFAKPLAVNSMRNTSLETIHAGRAPATKSGDYSDVRVIDADGTELPWNAVSRISDAEMKRLMRSVVDRLYTCLMRMNESEFVRPLAAYEASIRNWETPQVDQAFLDHLESLAVDDTR
ncbi:MAG: hypothetical protein AAGB04_31715 [Pseudomonadota bacterium]